MMENNTDQRIEELISRHMAQAKSEQYIQMDELQWLHYKREEAHKELAKSKKRLQASYQSLTSPTQIPTTKMGMLSFALTKGLTILQGVRMGFRIGDAIKAVVSISSLFKRKK